MDTNSYPIGSYWKVRNLKGVYQVTDSVLIGKMKKRRYIVMGIPNTGAIHVTTQAFGEDMTPADKPKDLLTELEPGSVGGELDEYSPGGRDQAVRDAQASDVAEPALSLGAPREPANAAAQASEGPRDAATGAYGDPRGAIGAQPTRSTGDRQTSRSDESEPTLEQLMRGIALTTKLKSAALSIWLGWPLKATEVEVLRMYLKAYGE